MMNVEKVKPTGLFTNYIYKAIPLAFDESMSYYETLCGLLSYLKDTVIPALNNNADAITEVQELMTQLQNYVDNYFNNLDVQEEINTKLDEMAESGVLEEIMADYLDTRAVFGFDTVADMKLATNLTNGSFARTLGYSNKNDGNGAMYKIRTITNEDIVNEINIIALADINLIAELIVEKEVISFNTVADMKSNTAIWNGNTVQTLGYYSANDGGGAKYIIRSKTNDDVVDEMFIIALSDVTLIAELIYYDIVNIKQLGAKGDNNQDETSIIQSALNKNKIVFIPEGNYKITNTLNMYNTYKIYGLEPHLSKITLSDKDKDIIKLKDGNTYNIAIHNLGLAHDEIGTGNGIVFGNSGVWQLNSISNCRLTNNNIGIYVKQSTGSLYSSEIKNCEIYNYNVAGIQLLNIGSSGNNYSNLYLHNNNRSSQYGVMVVQEDNFNANNLNIEWGEYTTAPLYLQLSNGFISNLHLEGVNSPVALQFFNRCSVSLENVWLNFVNSSYNIFNVDGANVKIKLNLLKLINNTESNQTVTSVRYTNDTHIQDDNEIIVNTLVTNNNQFTINYTTKKFGSHIIPEMFNNQKQSERVYNRWKAYTNASSNTFKQNDYGNQIEFINGIHVDDKDYLHAICIATGVATDQTISESGLITQYNSTIRYPKSDGQLTSGISLKIDGNLYITSSNSYSYDTDNYAINLNKNVSSTSGTYTIYKSEAQYKYL